MHIRETFTATAMFVVGVGWAVDRERNVWSTEDGGKTWIKGWLLCGHPDRFYPDGPCDYCRELPEDVRRKLEEDEREWRRRNLNTGIPS